MRLGVIGCGAIGVWHARLIAEHPAATLAALCDIDRARAEVLAGVHGGTAYDDAEKFFAAGLDAVVIATPEERHVADVALAAAAGVAVLIEKPVAPDLAGVAAIAAAVARSGIVAAAGHVERFETGSAQLKAAVAEGVCGAVVSVMARRQFGPADAPRFAGHSTTLRVLGVHDFDLVRWVHPAPIAEVYAAAGRGAVYDETGLDDHVVTTIRFADGAVAAVESAWTLPRAYQAWPTPAAWGAAGNNRLDVFGSAGFVSNDMSLRTQQLVAFDAAHGFRAAGLRHQPVVHGRVDGALRSQLDHFLLAVQRRAAPVVTLDDARRAVALTAAAEESLAAGRPVAVAL